MKRKGSQELEELLEEEEDSLQEPKQRTSREISEISYSESTAPEPKRPSRRKTSTGTRKLRLQPQPQSVTISRQAVKTAMELLGMPKRKFDKRKREEDELEDFCYCKYPKNITYETKYYHMRHLKESILNRKWEILPDLLDLFMNSISLFEYKKYETYFIELTHMVFQIHANFGNTDLLEKFSKRFFVPLKQDKSLTPFDVWYFEQ